MYAVMYQKVGCVQLLLNRKSNPNSVNKIGMSALSYAVGRGDAEGDAVRIIEMLVLAGADYDVERQNRDSFVGAFSVLLPENMKVIQAAQQKREAALKQEVLVSVLSGDVDRERQEQQIDSDGGDGLAVVNDSVQEILCDDDYLLVQHQQGGRFQKIKSGKWFFSKKMFFLII